MKCNNCENIFDKHMQQGGYVENKWYCNFCIEHQLERLSPEDTKFVFRKPDGSVEPIRFLKYTDCVSDSPNSTNT